MSEFLRHAPCPNCGSSDARAIYDDHEYCFSCKDNTGNKRSLTYYRNEAKQHYTTMILPEDFEYSIDKQGLTWLSKYSLTQKEIIVNRFGWSNKGIFLKKSNTTIAPLLVFPVFNEDGHLMMYQCRNFGEVGPKYLTYGAKDHLHILGEGDTIVLTEDLISAIKVSRITSAMPVWGSFLSPENAKRLSSRFSKAYMWLDKDKSQEAFKQAQEYSYLFKDGCTSIRTERDPKEYSAQEIKIYLTE